MPSAEMRVPAVFRSESGKHHAGFVRLDVATTTARPGSSLQSGGLQWRIHDDRLYEPVVTSVYGDPTSALSQLMRLGHYAVELEGMPSRIVLDALALAPAIADWTMDLSDTAVGRRMRQDARHLLLIDDVLHVFSAGPVLLLEAVRQDHALRGQRPTAVKVSQGSTVRALVNERDRAMRFDQAVEDIASTGFDEPDLPKFDIDASSLDLPDLRAASLDGIAMSMLTRVGHAGINDISFDLLDALQGIRRHFKEQEGVDPLLNPRRQGSRPIFDVLDGTGVAGLEPRVARVLEAMAMDTPSEAKAEAHHAVALQASRFPAILNPASLAELGALSP